MPNVKVLNMQGAAVGEIALADDVFGVEAHVSAMHTRGARHFERAAPGHPSPPRTRTEVRGGGRKIYRQKGTGNARHHGRRAPPVHPRRRGLRPQAPFLPHQRSQGHPPSGDEERALLQGSRAMR